MIHITLNGEQHETDHTLLSDILASLDLIHQEGVAVALNNTVIHKNHWATTHVAQGDVIEVVHAFAGG
jgi:sulfur carrier protein